MSSEIGNADVKCNKDGGLERGYWVPIIYPLSTLLRKGRIGQAAAECWISPSLFWTLLIV